MENGRLAPSCFLWAFCLLPVPGNISPALLFIKPGSSSWFQEQQMNPIIRFPALMKPVCSWSHLPQHQPQPSSTLCSEVWGSQPRRMPYSSELPGPANRTLLQRSEFFSSVQPFFLSFNHSSHFSLFLQP